MDGTKQISARWLALVVAALIILVVVGGVWLSDRSTDSPPAAAPTSEPTPGPADAPSVSPPASPRATVVVPDLRGRSAGQARSRLAEVGLHTESVETPYELCDGLVVGRQFPKPGRDRATGAAVWLTMTCGDRIDPDAEELVSMFLAWAREGKAGPWFADTVDLYLGHQPMKTLSSGQLSSPAAWSVCSPGYAGIVCPFSALDVIASTKAWERSGGMSAGCVAERGGRAVAARYDSFIELVAEDDMCHGHAVIDLYLREGRIAGVDLRIGSF